MHNVLHVVWLVCEYGLLPLLVLKFLIYIIVGAGMYRVDRIDGGRWGAFLVGLGTMVLGLAFAWHPRAIALDLADAINDLRR